MVLVILVGTFGFQMKSLIYLLTVLVANAWGVVFILQLNGHFFPWPKSWQNDEIMRDITFLELVPIVLALYLFKKELSERRIRFHTDNKALVAIINKKSSKSKSHAIGQAFSHSYHVT